MRGRGKGLGGGGNLGFSGQSWGGGPRPCRRKGAWLHTRVRRGGGVQGSLGVQGSREGVEWGGGGLNQVAE